MIEYREYQNTVTHFVTQCKVRMDDNKAMLKELAKLKICPEINWDEPPYSKSNNSSNPWDENPDGFCELFKALTIITQLELDGPYMSPDEKKRYVELMMFMVNDHNLDDLVARGGTADFKRFLSNESRKLFEWEATMRNRESINPASISELFTWDTFDEFFSTEKIVESQGEYEVLVRSTLKQLLDNESKTRLVSLLDMRLLTLLELTHAHGSSYMDKSGHLIFDDTLAARLQINNTICWSLGLPRKRRDRVLGLLENYAH